MNLKPKLRTIFLLPIYLLLISHVVFSQTTNPRLESVKISTCDQTVDVVRVQDRIISQTIDGSHYKLTVGMVTNCAGVYSADLKLDKDSLKIVPKEGKYIADTALNGKIFKTLVTYSCDCYYELSFDITGLNHLPIAVFVSGEQLQYFQDKYKTYPVQFSIKNNDTINIIDRYGLKQGCWYEDKPNKGYFTGRYINDRLKTAESKEFYPTGKIKSILTQTDFDDQKVDYYFENDRVEFFLRTDTTATTSVAYFENGSLKRVYIRNQTYFQEQLYYPDGHIKQITGNYIHQDYYPNGVLAKEFMFLNGDDISYKYYYDNGYLMATHYVDNKEKSKVEVKRKRTREGKIVKTFERIYWTEKVGDSWRYYTKGGKPASKRLLAKKGYTFPNE